MTLAEWYVIFVGCGGTFYTAIPTIAQWLQKWRPGAVEFVDHDGLEEENFRRQWALIGRRMPKAFAAAQVFKQFTPFRTASRFAEFARSRMGYKPEIMPSPVLLVVNTDNNASRLECRQWCIDTSKITTAGMVVTGCDGEKGQAYSGLWTPMGTQHDWLPVHEDVLDTTVEQHPPCGGQTLESNALTALCLGRALENFGQQVTSNPTVPPEEHYWEKNAETGLVKLWSRKAPVLKEENTNA